MKPQDIKRYFKTGYRFGKQTDMSPGSLYNWLKWGFVPIESQHKIERLTGGELKAEYEDINQR